MSRYSTLGSRIIALVIDLLIFAPLILLSSFSSDVEMPVWITFALIPATSFLGIGYNVLLHWKYGQTVGKMFVKVRVVDLSEQPITFSQALLRDIAYLITSSIDLIVFSALIAYGYSVLSDTFVAVQDYLLIPIIIWLAIDILVCLMSKKTRALHDLIAGTVVVRLDMPTEQPPNNKKLDPPGPEHYSELLTR